MSEDVLFPRYIPRPEEEQIRHQLARVQEEGSSRVVLLYGPGGIGKTSLVREMSRGGANDEAVAWLGPIDVDDSEFWLLSNLERHVAEGLDPQDKYFGRYREYLSRLPDYSYASIGREAVVSHLGRIKRVFVDCYAQFVQGSGKTVVIIFDTIEAIRGTYLLVTLTQWIKALPSTLFILSGRPMLDSDDEHEPIRSEFEGYNRLPVERVDLGKFTYDDAVEYLNSSEVIRFLSDEEKKKLVHLTQGHPLWLATAVSFLADRDMPEEANLPADEIERLVPYDAAPEHAGVMLQEEFKRHLVAPYRETDFWHEAIKRLAVLRQAVNAPVWEQLMADANLPRGVPTMQIAWGELMRQPWIRQRANGRYVTLHDAMAEELAHRILPLHDQDRQWQRDLWRHAMDTYQALIEDLAPKLDTQQAALDQRLSAMARAEGQGRAPTSAETKLIQDVARFEAHKREFDQFRTARLFYQLLSDFQAGCETFLSLFDEATRRADFYAQELFGLEMYRFLPGGIQRYALGDVVGEVIAEFRRWLPEKRPGLYRDIGISIAAYLNSAEQQQTALHLLTELPMTDAGISEMFRVNILLGNACIRIDGLAKVAERYFEAALAAALQVTSDDRQKMAAQAHKELGFCYRNRGQWKQADAAYQAAREAIFELQSVRDSDEDREEMASIYTNWAYVKGLNGDYRDGTNLAESAIAIRHRLNKYYDEGISRSVCGEVLRYERQFHEAWDSYAVAEEIFHGTRSWTWLGVIYQEQAICLFQAMQKGINLVPDPLKTAKHRISLSLDICRDQAVRNYPSALNRAGRIFGEEDPEEGLDYLSEGIEAARRLSDGWFWSANLVEYVELCYRAWVNSGGEPRYIDRITARESDIEKVMGEYEFPDLRGRWYLVQAHMNVRNWLFAEEKSGQLLASALDKYLQGFALIAQAYVGSSGASTLPVQFDVFAELFTQLPRDVRREWQSELRRSWRSLPQGSIRLLARLEALDW